MALFHRVIGGGDHGLPRAEGSGSRGSWFAFFAFLVLAFLFLGSPPAVSKGEEEEPDYPRLFSELSRNLNLHYLDLDRVDPKPLIEKAFAAIENAAEEIYVENSDPSNPILSVHVGTKAQAFNLNAVESLEQAIQMLENVFEFLKSHYQGESSLNDIRYAAANGFLSGLDPHTLVFSPDAFKDFSVHIEGEIYGVGMYVGAKDGKLIVLEVLKGTPALQAGFQKGDIITKIGDESTINMSVPEAVDKIRGQRYSTVALTVKRASKDDEKKLETKVIEVKRDRVEIKSVEAKLIPDWNKDGQGPWKGGVGYVKVDNFDKNTTNSLKRKLEELVDENKGPLAGLILDLRDNSGGLLQQAIEMTDLFLEKGEIVITASRGRRSEVLDPKSARKDGTEPEYPIIVLANEASASGAEIVIGALQKNNRAVVLGTRTFGKGSVQQLHALRNGAQLKITVSEYLIPGKISIQENGVVPDIDAKPVRFEDGDYDLFSNERSLTEKNYETHIVSKFAKEEKPTYALDYFFEPAKDDPFTNRFMSGDLEPAKDKLVQVALRLLAFSEKPFSPSALLKAKQAEMEKIEDELFQEIVQELKERGIDWSPPPGGDQVAAADASAKLELSLHSDLITEPSEDPEDPVPMNKLVVTAKLTNKGDKPFYRMKGLSKSDFYIYKDQEFLFGKVDPGETVARSVKIRLQYFPHARNDLFTVEVSSTAPKTAIVERGETPQAPPADRTLTAASLQIELTDKGRPSFAYSAELMDAAQRKPLSSLKAGDDAVLRVKVKNIGNAPAYKGATILKNDNGRQIFLAKERPEFTNLQPGTEMETEIPFEVRDGDATEYKFDLIIVDSYSGAALTRKLTIARGGKDDSKPFPQGVAFAPPAIEVALLDPETRKPVILTGRDSLKLEAVIRSPDTDPFKAWIINSQLGSEHDTPPDKIFYADSRGEPQLKIATSVPLKKGVNLFTVVTNDRNGLESRHNIVVRRE